MSNSVTRLQSLNLTPGKLRGLQRISNENGTLTMVALDQNNSMIDMIKSSGLDPTFDAIVEAKVHLARRLAPAGSALLVDAYYGAWNTVASYALPRHTGLLIRVERSGGEKNAKGAPLGAVEPGWSVAKIKRLGADAVKLLAQFEPTEPNSAEHQFEFIRKIYEECQKHDILFLLETVAFNFDVDGKEGKKSKTFLDRKAATVIDSAKWVSRYCDIYKAEFPGTFGHETDAQLQENLDKLNAVCERPWVLLSAGVDFPAYKKQVEMAMKAGASGVLGGRAFWKEYFLKTKFEERDAFAKGECVSRVKQIDDIVKAQGKSWHSRYGLSMEDLQNMRACEGWHARYAGGQSVGKAQHAEGEVY
jgi:tagatose 1,6-diphosphate aldolase